MEQRYPKRRGFAAWQHFSFLAKHNLFIDVHIPRELFSMFITHLLILSGEYEKRLTARWGKISRSRSDRTMAGSI
jgi:hypothetical protein